jgi:hypothetical protein
MYYISSMADITVGNWPAQKLGPSGIFEHINLDTFQMVARLDEKMHTLAPSAGYTGRMFGKWLSAVHKFASAVIFHGGEVISEGADPLTAIVVTGEPNLRRILDETQKTACAGVINIGVVSVVEFMPLIAPKEGGSSLRPFLSSELLVLGAQRDVEMLEAFFSALRSAFESHFIDDLASLVSADIKRDIFRDFEPDSVRKKPDIPILLEETDFSGRKPIKRRVIDEREFGRVAIKAMFRRRIPLGLQSFIMPKVKLTVAQVN